MGWLERWDRRNQQWAERVTATPPTDTPLPRWMWLLDAGPLAPLLAVVALVLAVRRRRRKRTAGASSGRC